MCRTQTGPDGTATRVCQVHSEDAYYGHLVLRLMGCLVFYTSWVICCQ
jgi:hypothetical protein